MTDSAIVMFLTLTNVQKMAHIAELLQQWSWSFPVLIQNWLEYKNGALLGKRRKNKVADIESEFFSDVGKLFFS